MKKLNLWVVLGAVVSFALGFYSKPVSDDSRTEKFPQSATVEQARLAEVELK